MMKKIWLIKRIFLLLFLLSFAACGGGGGGSSGGSSANSGTVSTFVTDNISQEFNEAWITIKRVTISDLGNTEFILYDDANGKVFNLLELSGIGKLLNISTIPPGSYNKIGITVANQITLVNKSGQTINAKFSPTGTDYTIVVNGNVTVNAGQNTSFGIDFDTKQFTYNAQTGIVTATVIFKSGSEIQFLSQRYAELKGYVKDVTGSSTFTVQTENGFTISVRLHQTAVVFDENTGAKTTDTSLLKSGQRVEARGDYDPATLTLEAISVKIEKTSGSGGGSGMVEAKGVVTSINGSILTLDVKDTDHFIPPSNTIRVDISQAMFSKGNLSLLSVGQWIEVKGTWNGTTLSATVIEIEGAPAGDRNQNSNGNSNQNNNGNSNQNNNGGNIPYVEIKGTVQSVNGNQITLSVIKYEHFVPPTNTVQVDVSNAWYKHGSYSNLLPGILVEIKGSWNGSIIIATVVEFDD